MYDKKEVETEIYAVVAKNKEIKKVKKELKLKHDELKSEFESLNTNEEVTQLQNQIADEKKRAQEIDDEY